MDKLKKFLFGEQSLGQTFAKNSFWLTVSNVGSGFLKIAIVIYAARLLGAEEYGLFSYAIGVAAIFTAFSDLGLGYLFSIKVAQGEKEQEAYLSTLFFLRVGLIATIILMVVAAGPLIARFPEAKILIPLIALLLAFDDLRALMAGVARAENRMDKEAFGHITTNAMITVLAFVGLRYSPDSFMLTSMYLLGSALGTLAMFFAVKKKLGNILWPIKFDPGLVKDIFAAAIPFGLAGAMWTIMVNTDTLVIGWFRTATELGYYAAAQRPVMALSLISTVMVGGSLTLIVRLIKEGAKERLKNFVERLVTFSLAIVLPLFVGGVIVAPSIMLFLYGEEYAPGTLSFQLLLATMVLTYPSSIVTSLLLAQERQRIYTIAMIGGALGNAILDIILIPRFGIEGSVIATIGALGIIYVYIWRKAKKVQPFAVLSHLPRIILATTIMGFITFALNLASVNLFINIIVSGLTYFGVLVVSREPILGELKRIIRFQ